MRGTPNARDRAQESAEKTLLDASARTTHAIEGERMRTLKRAVLFGTAAMALGAMPALSQSVTFSTTGAFTGGGGTCNASTTCTFGAYTITFTGSGSTTYLAPSLVDVGSFATGCTPIAGSCASSSPAAGTTFTLTITQTAPGGGTGTFAGLVQGAVSLNPTQNTLKWTPTTSTISIAGVVYTLVVDNSGNINILAPTGGDNPNNTAVKANIVTPEPSTIALMATGIFSLVPLIRRRRR